MVHANRLCPFKHPKSMPKEQIEALAATDLDDFYVEKILNIQARARIPRNGNFVFVGWIRARR